MSHHIPAPLRDLVHRRAAECCEYCRLPQASQEATFHVDHIDPSSAGGPTDKDNLALACVTCPLRKAARTRVRDSRSGKLMPLFHPRRDRWNDHFRWTLGWKVIGRTPIGRASVTALAMNRPAIVSIRQCLARLGDFPP